MQFERVLANTSCYEEGFPARASCYNTQRRSTGAVFCLLGDLLTSGQAKEDKNDHEGALADYDHAIRLRPDSAEAYFRRGRVLSHQDKSNAALSDFSKAIELDPNMTEALAARASLLLTRRNDFAASIADYDKLINLGVSLDHSLPPRSRKGAP